MVDAQFSVPHAVAMVLLDRPRAGWWEPANRTDPAVLDLMDRVGLETDPAAQATWVTVRHSARIPATVVIETSGGTVAAARPHARGGADEPLTDAEVERKLRALVEPVVGAPAAARLVERVNGGEPFIRPTRGPLAMGGPRRDRGCSRAGHVRTPFSVALRRRRASAPSRARRRGWPGLATARELTRASALKTAVPLPVEPPE